MTAKEYLQRGWNLNREIEALQDAKRRSYDRCTSATVRPSGMPGGAPTVDVLSSYVDFSAEIDRQIGRLVGIQREIAGVIGKVQDNRLRMVLTERYVCFKRWEDIAAEQHYSWQHTMRMHKNALRVVDAILKDETQ